MARSLTTGHPEFHDLPPPAMPPESPSMTGSGDVPTLLVHDSQGRQLLCYLEQLIPLDNHDYALMTPVDTPVKIGRAHV